MAAMRGKRTRKHTEPCRNRFMKVFESTPQGRPRIEVVSEMMENSRNLVQDGKNDEVELEDRAFDAMFEARRWTQEEEEAAKATAAAQAVNRLVRASAELDEDGERRKRPRWCHRKRKLEEEAKQQEDDAKRQKQEEGERKFAAKTCGDDPRLVGLGGKVW